MNNAIVAHYDLINIAKAINYKRRSLIVFVVNPFSVEVGISNGLIAA